MTRRILVVAMALSAVLVGCSGPTRSAVTGPTSVPFPAGSPSGPTTTSGGTCTDRSVVDGWPLARQAAQVIAVPVLDAQPSAVQLAVADDAGGILLLGSVPPAAELAAALAAARTSRPALLVMADEEGGAVQRLSGDVTPVPSARQMAATMTTAAVERLGETVGRQMLALGVNTDLAPVLDLDAGAGPSATNPDGTRSFSASPGVAVAYGVAFMRGLEMGGVLPVVKHFPGLGGATGNTDYGPAATPPLATLEAAGLQPFRAAIAAGAPAVMVSNASVPGLTPLPASVSPDVVTGLLEDQLHFNGLVLTDSLSAGALSGAGYDVANAAVAAVRAGADMVLFGSTLTASQSSALAGGSLSAQITAIEQALVSGVHDGSLPASRLAGAALDVVRAKHADLCGAGRG